MIKEVSQPYRSDRVRKHLLQVVARHITYCEDQLQESKKDRNTPSNPSLCALLEMCALFDEAFGNPSIYAYSEGKLLVDYCNVISSYSLPPLPTASDHNSAWVEAVKKSKVEVARLPSWSNDNGRHRILWEGDRWLIVWTKQRGFVAVYDLQQQQQTQHNTTEPNAMEYFRAAGCINVVKRCGNMVVLGLRHGKIQVFDLTLWRLRAKGTHTYAGHAPGGKKQRSHFKQVGEINDIFVDSTEIISASQDGTLSVFPLPNLRQYYLHTPKRQRKRDRKNGKPLPNYYPPSAAPVTTTNESRSFVRGDSYSVAKVGCLLGVVVSVDTYSTVCVWDRYSTALLYRVRGDGWPNRKVTISMTEGLLWIYKGQSTTTLHDFAFSSSSTTTTHTTIQQQDREKQEIEGQEHKST